MFFLAQKADILKSAETVCDFLPKQRPTVRAKVIVLKARETQPQIKKKKLKLSNNDWINDINEHQKYIVPTKR